MYLLLVKSILKKYFTYICKKLTVQYFTFSLFISCMPHSSELWLNLFFLFVPSYLGSLGAKTSHIISSQWWLIIEGFLNQIKNKTSKQQQCQNKNPWHLEKVQTSLYFQSMIIYLNKHKSESKLNVLLKMTTTLFLVIYSYSWKF